MKRANEGINLINLTIDATTIPDRLKDVLPSTSNYLPNTTPTQGENLTPTDETYVKPPIIIPIKNEKTTDTGG